jgi:N,N'-diacetyllegionaminate synthase
MSGSFQLGRKRVGGDAPCLLIAEVGLGHDGSLGQAHAYVDAVADAGVDVVKFQTHMASSESTPQEQFRVKVFPQDATRYGYWERTAFTEPQWLELRQHAEQRGLEFLSTPFSVRAVELLRRIGVKGWKIGSGETNNPLLLQVVGEGREPVLLSTGMSYLHEIGAAVELLHSKGAPVLVMQCASRYPCPPDRLGLNVIGELQRRFGIPVGFSDHSGEVAAGLAAITLGAKAVEVHVTWHRKSFGPDVQASLTLEHLHDLVRGARIIESALSNSVDKDHEARQLDNLRSLFNKGLVAAADIARGTIIERSHIDARKPCVGIPVAEFERALGRAAARDIRANEHIVWDDLS